MGYLHIENLYNYVVPLMFKRVYALEKIHGSSAHILYESSSSKLKFHCGGIEYDRFINIFDHDVLYQRIQKLGHNCVYIYGECYGGKMQRMSNTYGKELKFIAFDVKINEYWLNVPNAYDVVNRIGLEFVNYEEVDATVESLDNVKNRPSVQAIRNGCGNNKKREGIVIRPLYEFFDNNGKRVIAKHKNEEFIETNTKREVDPEKLKVLEDANEIANEWVTNNRLNHVLDKLPLNIDMRSVKLVINAMVEDIIREAKNEIVDSGPARKAICNKTAKMFKKYLNDNLLNCE